MTQSYTLQTIRILIATSLCICSVQIKAVDILSIAVGALVSSGISSVTNWITKPSNDSAEYEKRHNHFKTLSKEAFLEEIAAMNTTSGLLERDILSQHELYRYPNFIAAIKTACPSYGTYIKALFAEISSNYKARMVRGFKVEKRGSFITRNLRSVKSTDYYEFYELIKTLYNQVLEDEEKTLLQAKLKDDLLKLEKIISQLPIKDQQAFLEKQLKDLHV